MTCCSAGITVPASPNEVIALGSAGMDIRASSSTAELERMRNLLDDYESCFAAMEADVSDYLDCSNRKS